MSRPSRALLPLVLIFFISGSAGLVHEIVWARALGQVLGNSLQSVTAVLVVFLGGLGLGALLGSRRASRSTTAPLRDYAWLEFFVGLWGLSAPAIIVAVEAGLRSLGPSIASGALLLPASRIATVCLVLAPPTLAMGATFPLMIREARRRGVASESAVRSLYGWNTVGAALGALVGAFALLPFLGTRGSFLTAAIVNLLAGGAALLLNRGERITEPEIGPGDRIARPLSLRLTVASSAAVLSGGIGALLQIGWTRATTLAFGSSVYALGITLAAYVLGIGIGPLLVTRRLLERRTAALAAGTAWIVGTSSLLVLPVLGRLPEIGARLSGRHSASPLLMLSVQFGIVFLFLLVPTLAQGAIFPGLARMAESERAFPSHRAASLVYACSTGGSVAGLIAGGFVLIPGIGAERMLRGAGLVALLLSMALLLARSTSEMKRPRPVHAATFGLLLLLSALLAALPGWDREVMSSGGFLYGPVYGAAGDRRDLREMMRRRGELVFESEGGDALVTVRRGPTGVLSLQINGKTEASTGGDMPTQLLAGHLPLLLHPRPSEVLVIGLASGVTLGAVERHSVNRIRVVEIAPSVVEAAPIFAPHNGDALEDDRVELVIDDARAHLLVNDDRYDVIASQLSNPWVAGVANLFTVEFYRMVRSHLRPGGLFCQWVQAYRLDPEDLRGVVQSFLEVFPEATAWEESAGSGDYFLIGSDGALQVAPERFSSPEAEPALVDLRRAGIKDPADLLVRFVSGPRGLREFAAGAPPQTDDDLYLEWRAPLALFRHTLRDQVAALNRHRQPVLTVLRGDVLREQPDLIRRLGHGLREREARLRILEGMNEADLATLADPFMAAGVEYLRSGLYVEAVGALRRAAEDNPGSGTAKLLLGKAYRAAGLDEAAVVVFRQAVADHPELAAGWNALGRSLWSMDRMMEARTAFEEAVRRAPRFAAARNNFGAITLYMGDVPLAERELRQALAEDPALGAAHANLGLALKRAGNAPEAEREYRAALELDPLNTVARYNLAELLRISGREAEAREALRHILRIDPSDAEARAALLALEGGSVSTDAQEGNRGGTS
jgi:spermidine synthase